MNCRIEGCDRGGKIRRGLCPRHYTYMMRHDGAVPTRLEARGTQAERFWAKVDKNGPVPDYRPDLGPCWLWTGAMRSRYGRIYDSESHRVAPAHRWSYSHCVGTIPDGLEIDHLCRVPSCVNPNHLEPVTKHENMLRGESPYAKNAMKTHCKWGHPLPPYRGQQRGDCLACRALRNEARRRFGGAVRVADAFPILLSEAS